MYVKLEIFATFCFSVRVRPEIEGQTDRQTNNELEAITLRLTYNNFCTVITND